MKPFYLQSRRRKRAFSLVEAALSVGILSFGFLSVAPLVDLGVNSARQARTNRMAAQIAETLIQQAQQGTLTAGTVYFDSAENIRPTAAGACFQVQSALATVVAAPGGGALTRLTVQVTPLGEPARSQFYAVVLPPE